MQCSFLRRPGQFRVLAWLGLAAAPFSCSSSSDSKTSDPANQSTSGGQPGGGAPAAGGSPAAGGEAAAGATATATPGGGGTTPGGGGTTPGGGGTTPIPDKPNAPDPDPMTTANPMPSSTNNPPVMPTSSATPETGALATPSVSGDTYTVALENGAALVADGVSGRVTELNFGGVNLLTDATVNPLNYGASFWTAPQSTWGWPPPLDKTTYTAVIDGLSILFTSAVTKQVKESVSITKRFSGDSAAGKLFLEYTIKNEGAEAISVAPWEVSRLRANGLTFYPTGSSVAKAQLMTTEMGGVTWLDYETAGINGIGRKNAADGAEGWLAHVDAGVLFLKSFPDVPAGAEAPEEGEIEIYVDGGRAYVELEQQGALMTLEPGAVSPPWKVVWQVSTLPAEIPATIGSEALLAYVRDLLK